MCGNGVQQAGSNAGIMSAIKRHLARIKEGNEGRGTTLVAANV